jgi:hypothetical protein
VVCTGTPNVFLGDVRWGDASWSRDCSPEDKEVIAFAGGHQPYNATPPEPAGGEGSLWNTVTPVAFSGPLRVDVKLWVVAEPGAVGAQARAHEAALALVASDGESKTAERVFADLGTGIELRFTSDTFPSQGFGLITNLYTSASCALVGPITSRGSTGYDTKQLNVYYVDGVQGNRAGLNCHGIPTATGGPGQNVMFVAGNRYYSAYQLAHELGHAMGLLHSAATPSGGSAPSGDVDEMYLDPYLATDNLMQSGSAEVNQVTLGQIYRMHYDKLSWRWSQPGASPAASGYPRECQNSPVEGGLCPPLTLHPARGWP